MNELSADFTRSIPCLAVLSFTMIYAAWRIFCRTDTDLGVDVTRLTGVIKIQYRDDAFARVFFWDGTTRLFEKKHLALKDHKGQIFSNGPDLGGCELIIASDEAQKCRLVVEVPALLFREPSPAGEGLTNSH